MNASPSPALDAASRPRLLSAPVVLLIQGIISAAGLVVEIVAGRMLAPYVGMSLYSWTAVIAVVLAGFSAGHWVGGVVAERPRRDSLALIAVLTGLAALTTAMTLIILRALSAPILSQAPAPGAAILTLATVVAFLPSFFAGTPSPVLAKTMVDLDPARAGKSLGAIFAAGSIGAIAGTLAAGYLFISWLGSTLTIVAVTLTYAIAALLLLVMAGNGRQGGRYWIALALALAASFLLTAYNLGLGSVCTRESRYYCIRIVDFTPEIGTPAKLMVLDHLGHGINLANDPEELVTPYVALIDRFVTRRTGGVPASSFFIGGGAYTLPRAWLAASPESRITVSEIDSEVTRLAIDDMWVPANGIEILHEDARIALARRPTRYDVIVGDAFTDIAVPPHLVTLEFFELVKTRLEEDGLYAMNVVDHVPGMPALLAIYRTLKQAFAHVEVFAEQGDFLAGGRTTFVLFASPRPSGLDRIDGADGQLFVRIAGDALDARLAEQPAPLLTDDYAPIDRLVGIGEL
ncbi:MAG: fused MFS/spermidine synthase [Alphaproteobacteria bacterium]